MRMSVDTGDLGLVQRVQKGDKTAFDLLVRKYQHKVVKLVTRYLRDPADAEDVAQEAFIKAYRAIPQFRGDSAFYTWLYRIAINTAKNAIVSRDRSPVEFDLDLQSVEILRELGLSPDEIEAFLAEPDRLGEVAGAVLVQFGQL